MRVTVLSYNIHSGVGTDGVLDLERLAAVMEGSGADLLGLQEVDRHRREQSAFEDQPGWLARRLRMEHAYAVCLDEEPPHPGAPRSQYGTAVLTRLPLLGSRTTMLPCWDGSEQRGLLDVEVDVGGTALRVLGTHLQWDREEERVEQARALVEHLDDRPTLLVGDLNTTPGSPTHAVLAEVLEDAWEAVGHGDGHTFTGEPPARRIDYVWTGGGVRPVAAEVVSSPASDHSALRVVVEVP